MLIFPVNFEQMRSESDLHFSAHHYNIITNSQRTTNKTTIKISNTQRVEIMPSEMKYENKKHANNTVRSVYLFSVFSPRVNKQNQASDEKKFRPEVVK